MQLCFFFLRIGDAADDIAFFIDDDGTFKRPDQTAPECFTVLIAEKFALGKFGFIKSDCLCLMRQLVDAVNQFLIHSDHNLSDGFCPAAFCRCSRKQRYYNIFSEKVQWMQKNKRICFAADRKYYIDGRQICSVWHCLFVSKMRLIGGIL